MGRVKVLDPNSISPVAKISALLDSTNTENQKRTIKAEIIHLTKIKKCHTPSSFETNTLPSG